MRLAITSPSAARPISNSVGRDAPIAPRRIGAIRPTSAGFAPTTQHPPSGADELDAEAVGAACGRDLQVPDARHEQRAARCAVRLLPQPKSHPRGVSLPDP